MSGSHHSQVKHWSSLSRASSSPAVLRVVSHGLRSEVPATLVVMPELPHAAGDPSAATIGAHDDLAGVDALLPCLA